MDRLVINNLGPISHADLVVNKVNVFMGPQSSGKSTLVKALCYCRWIEKRATMDESLERFKDGKQFMKLFMEFHKLSPEYFSLLTRIEYNGKSISIVFASLGSEFSVNWRNIGPDNDYQNNKLIYLPAERNFVSAVPNLTKYVAAQDNLLNFIYDWYDIKSAYTSSKELEILNLGAKFYQSEINENGAFKLGNGLELPLKNASSGLQSITPLLVIFDFLSEGIYEDKRPMSYEERDSIIRRINDLLRQAEKEKSDTALESAAELLNLVKKNEYSFSQFFIEEPEQNLFPATQKDLIYHLLKGCQNVPNRDHQLFITTHSPFILYALNNCMLGHIANQNSSNSELLEQPSSDAWIAPAKVSIWQIQEGVLNSIQDEVGLIQENYFDQVMKAVMDEFYEFLPYSETETQA